jgi:hypothetical protein
MYGSKGNHLIEKKEPFHLPTGIQTQGERATQGKLNPNLNFSVEVNANPCNNSSNNYNNNNNNNDKRMTTDDNISCHHRYHHHHHQQQQQQQQQKHGNEDEKNNKDKYSGHQQPLIISTMVKKSVNDSCTTISSSTSSGSPCSTSSPSSLLSNLHLSSPPSPVTKRKKHLSQCPQSKRNRKNCEESGIVCRSVSSPSSIDSSLTRETIEIKQENEDLETGKSQSDQQKYQENAGIMNKDEDQQLLPYMQPPPNFSSISYLNLKSYSASNLTNPTSISHGSYLPPDPFYYGNVSQVLSCKFIQTDKESYNIDDREKINAEKRNKGNENHSSNRYSTLGMWSNNEIKTKDNVEARNIPPSFNIYDSTSNDDCSFHAPFKMSSSPHAPTSSYSLNPPQYLSSQQHISNNRYNNISIPNLPFDSHRYEHAIANKPKCSSSSYSLAKNVENSNDCNELLELMTNQAIEIETVLPGQWITIKTYVLNRLQNPSLDKVKESLSNQIPKCNRRVQCKNGKLYIYMDRGRTGRQNFVVVIEKEFVSNIDRKNNMTIYRVLSHGGINKKKKSIGLKKDENDCDVIVSPDEIYLKGEMLSRMPAQSVISQHTKQNRSNTDASSLQILPSIDQIQQTLISNQNSSQLQLHRTQVPLQRSSEPPSLSQIAYTLTQIAQSQPGSEPSFSTTTYD